MGNACFLTAKQQPMKTIVVLFISIVLFSSCNSGVVEKPDNLINEDKMVNIIYDLSVLEAIRLDNPASLAEKKINPSLYIYKKYKIDSLQFAKSDRYYASDIAKYAGIYDKVNSKLDYDKKVADALNKKNSAKKVVDTLKKDTVTNTISAKERRLKQRQLIRDAAIKK